MTLDIIRPTTAAEAIELLAASPLPFDSPTHHRYRTRDHLDRVFSRGFRRPEWVWAARDGEGVRAVVAALEMGPGAVLDHVGDGDDDALAAVLAAATADLRHLEETEAGIFVPASVDADTPAFQRWVRLLGDAGWSLLVARHHYEFEPPADLGAATPLTLHVRAAASAEEVELLMREVLRGTSDAHDLALVEEVGIEKAARQGAQDLLDDSLDCIRLASDTPGGEPIALASWVVPPGGIGYLSYVGVAESARGRGYAKQLVAAASRDLVAGGARVVVADTDETNVAMARAFATARWPVTETRMDFVLADA